MEWPACLDEYEKLVIRMNTPRSVFFLFKKCFPSAVFFLFSFCSSLSIRFCAIVYKNSSRLSCLILVLWFFINNYLVFSRFSSKSLKFSWWLSPLDPAKS